MLETLARIILRYRVASLVILLGITVFMGYTATKVQLSYEGAKILPASDSTYAEYLKFKQKFGERLGPSWSTASRIRRCGKPRPSVIGTI